MRMQEVVDQLRQQLPAYTDRFHDVVPVSSLVATATTATVSTSKNHGLETGNMVALTSVESRSPIISVSQSTFLTTFETSSDHDLTEGNPDTLTIPLQGFTDPQWNASHELVGVPNRRTFTVKNLLAEPVLSGNEILLEPNRVDGVNGVYPVTVTGKRTFTVDGSFIAGTYTPFAGKVISNPRVFVSVSLDRARQQYEDYPEQFWCFVVPGVAVTSKDRSTQSDAIATRVEGETLRLRLLDEFSVYVFAPTSDELAAAKSVDICRHELLGPIVWSLYGLKLETGLACPTSEFRLTITGHGISDYNGAYLIHEFAFQAPADLTDGDAAKRNQDRAFREIDFTLLGPHTPLTALIDLDEEPLP